VFSSRFILLPRDRDGNGLSTGEGRKRLALEFLESLRPVLLRRGRRALLTCLLSNGAATIDDVRHAVPLPVEVSPKLFGAVPGPLAKGGIIKGDGLVRSCRPEAHARPVTFWRLADRAEARRWLWLHPDLPDYDPSQSPGQKWPLTVLSVRGELITKMPQ
jgi:hypothetical protein